MNVKQRPKKRRKGMKWAQAEREARNALQEKAMEIERQWRRQERAKTGEKPRETRKRARKAEFGSPRVISREALSRPDQPIPWGPRHSRGDSN